MKVSKISLLQVGERFMFIHGHDIMILDGQSGEYFDYRIVGDLDDPDFDEEQYNGLYGDYDIISLPADFTPSIEELEQFCNENFS